MTGIFASTMLIIYRFISSCKIGKDKIKDLIFVATCNSLSNIKDSSAIFVTPIFSIKDINSMVKIHWASFDSTNGNIIAKQNLIKKR